MRRVQLSGLALLCALLALPGFSLTVTTGTGPPNLQGWCQLDWRMGIIIGHGGVTDRGLLLSAAQMPPVPGYELNLKYVNKKELLIFFESPNPAGRVFFYLDDRVVNVQQVPIQGEWWVKLTDLPSSGSLRIELGPCTDEVLIRGIYYPCEVCPSCLPWFIAGVVVGGLLVWLVMR